MTGQAAHILEEIDEISHRGLTNGGQFDQHIGDAAVYMGQDSASHSLLRHKGEGLSRQEIEAVHVVRIVGDDELPLGGKLNYSFKHEPLSLLDILAHGVEVGSKFYAGREEAFALLALTLSVQLLPPLGKEAEGRLVAGQ